MSLLFGGSGLISFGKLGYLAVQPGKFQRRTMHHAERVFARSRTYMT